MTIQVKTFSKMEDLNQWLQDSGIEDSQIIKMYSNGPDYFFVEFKR